MRTGLCCALALARRGLKDIHVVERNPSPEFFEVDKAYLYRIDGRGERRVCVSVSCLAWVEWEGGGAGGMALDWRVFDR
jgi:hypothetical protein